LKYKESHWYEAAKTLMYRADVDWFEDRLVDELKYNHLERHERVACRLNGGSDLDWTHETSVIWRVPEVQFLDYTKVPSRMWDFIKGRLPTNYHLTFSRGAKNWPICLDILAEGGDVAVVVRNKPRCGVDYFEHPLGGHCEIIDGDLHDLRHLDRRTWAVRCNRGSLVLLSPKPDNKTTREDKSGFIIDSLEDIDVMY
jgi:hypothetical protein